MSLQYPRAIVATLTQFAITYLPLKRVFATEPVTLIDGLLIVGVGSTPSLPAHLCRARAAMPPHPGSATPARERAR